MEAFLFNALKLYWFFHKVELIQFFFKRPHQTTSSPIICSTEQLKGRKSIRFGLVRFSSMLPTFIFIKKCVMFWNNLLFCQKNIYLESASLLNGGKEFQGKTSKGEVRIVMGSWYVIVFLLMHYVKLCHWSALCFCSGSISKCSISPFGTVNCFS